MSNGTLCILGCGNLGTAILKSLLASKNQLFTKYVACVASHASTERLKTQFASSLDKTKNLSISTGDNVSAIQNADVVILALDPSVISSGLSQEGIANALGEKLLISVAAGWTVQKLYETLYGSNISQGEKAGAGKASIIRTLPTITALVGQSLTAIEINPSSPPNQAHLELTDDIFASIGKTQHIPPTLIDATTAVAGSTPAMFAIIVDAMVDAAVAVGVPRPLAQGMVLQSMAGSAAIMQGGTSPAELRDQGTSPEGCTIGGIMVLEERGVRGGIQRAVREAVTLARRMDGVGHFNDTRP
ncbi:pyrroline-5-carboxylate reductase dimerization-domain-containing protein [Aspergillus filifer]